MNKNILITGGRAPSALELARLLSKNNTVYVADSLYFALARFSRHVKRFIHTRRPAHDLKGFRDDLITAIRENDIHILIPTCEEAFYVSQLKSTLQFHCDVFVDTPEKMKAIHSKIDVFNLIDRTLIQAPATEVIEKKNVDNALVQNNVVKVEFSRFGNGVFTKAKDVVDIDQHNRYLKQEKLTGTEYSTYTIAKDGVVIGSCVYKSLYRIKDSAGVYFQPLKHEKIEAFIEAFIRDNDYTGQIGFDVIDTGSDIYLIDANPRATSGIHLLEGTLDLDSASAQLEPGITNKGIMLAVVLLADKRGFSFSRFANHVASYKEAVFKFSDPLPSLCQLLTLGELIYRKYKHKVYLLAASTFDIEWDGK